MKKMIIIGAAVGCLFVLGLLIFNTMIRGEQGNPGETPTLTVIVKNAPGELYYLDLLIPDTERMLTIDGFVAREPLEAIPGVDEIKNKLYCNVWMYHPDASILEVPRIDNEIKNLLYSYEGWIPALVDRDIQGGPDISYTAAPRGEDMHHGFGYVPPSIFRILIITESHIVTISDVYEVSDFYSIVEFDYATSEMSADGIDSD